MKRTGLRTDQQGRVTPRGARMRPASASGLVRNRTLGKLRGVASIERTPNGPDPRANELLAALPDEDYSRVAPHLRPEFLPLGKALLEIGATTDHVYFPTTALVSLLSVMENGSSAEIAITGRDGLVGISLFMGGATTTTRAVVQSAGYAYRLDVVSLMREFESRGALHNLLLRFTQALVTQMVQTAACNRHHSVEQQLCRWLLLSLDLLPSNDLVMTHDLIANMLGVRRAGVTLAAGKLQADDAMTYTRGKITVLDRAKIEACACECYKVVKTEVARIMARP